jgi:hypothetical protein
MCDESSDDAARRLVKRLCGVTAYLSHCGGRGSAARTALVYCWAEIYLAFTAKTRILDECDQEC